MPSDSQWNSILEPDKFRNEVNVKLEADVIITATVLGFIGTRYHLDQPCSFDIEHPTLISVKDDDQHQNFIREYQEFLHVMSAMSEVLAQTDPEIGKFLKDSQSPEGSAGALITGRAGGQSLSTKSERIKVRGAENSNKLNPLRFELIVFQESGRHRQMKSLPAQGNAKSITNSTRIYQGRGAYTGMIDDPVTHKTLVQPTKRVIDRNPARWHPNRVSIKNWGLIKVDSPSGKNLHLEDDPKQGMGPLPKDDIDGNARIGYIHGMSSAIEACICAGPWCTPYEMATGNLTTKMASCFPCCTYMYAAGFPPSSMHLGRGESWVPPSPLSSTFETGDKEPLPTYREKVTSSLATRWHYEVYGYMRLGQDYLETAVNKRNDKECVNPSHMDAVSKLKMKLNSIPVMSAGNLFLDALTIHDSDWRRIQRTLQPAYNALQDKAKKIEDDIGKPKPISQQMASSDATPALLNGMKVIFDQLVAVTPVILESKTQERRHGTRQADRIHRSNGHKSNQNGHDCSSEQLDRFL